MCGWALRCTFAVLPNYAKITMRNFAPAKFSSLYVRVAIPHKCCLCASQLLPPLVLGRDYEVTSVTMLRLVFNVAYRKSGLKTCEGGGGKASCWNM